MNATADTIQDRDNMIKRLNKLILAKILGIRLRPVGAVLLGCFAGLSLTTNVIPSALSLAGLSDSFSARWELGGYAVYSCMVWAVGGWAVQKTGSKLLGAIILGSVGLASGLLFTAFGMGTAPELLVTGGGASLLYGAIGGMIIGEALRNPSPPAAAEHEVTKAKKIRSEHKPHKESEFRFLRFFK